MSANIEGLSLEYVYLSRHPIPAFVLRYSRPRQVLGLLFALGFVPASIAMFLRPEAVDVPILRSSVLLTQAFAIVSAIFFLSLILVSIQRLFADQGYLALTAQGILSTGTQPPAFIPWDAIEELKCEGSSTQLLISLRIRGPETVPSLQPFINDMRSNRDLCGWDWGFGMNVFETSPHVIRTALEYFYFYPHKRTEIGLQNGLAALREAIAQKWKMPVVPLPEA